MSDFTYQIPDERKFFAAVLQILTKGDASHKQIAGQIHGGRCSIVSSSQFSYQRWNAYHTEVHFYVPVDKLTFFDKKSIEVLRSVCERVMPKDTGFDIMGVEIAPILDDIKLEATLSNDLEEIKDSLSEKQLTLLPDDIKDKGKEMSEVYIYLYCVENSIRLFIDQVFKDALGDDYWSNILIPNAVKNGIKSRKELEAKNQWISVRATLIYSIWTSKTWQEL